MCRQQLSEETRFPPFCSERCKLLDLGAWASESYKIAAEPALSEELAQELLNDADGAGSEDRSDQDGHKLH